ncbi:MAG TPA: PRD domain-containing protein [Symbiobacteriaceae bacterium]|nr:PRD domain-containing protein [Symbiobacteriaceae bacterium]
MNPIAEITERLSLNTQERGAIVALLQAAESLATKAGFGLDDDARLGLGAHLGHLLRRLASGERVEGVDASMFEEVPAQLRAMASELLAPCFAQVDLPVDPVEIGLVALHFGAAQERTALSA